MGILDSTKSTSTASAYGGTGTVQKKDDPVVETKEYTVKADDTLWSLMDDYFPYLKYDIGGKFRKIEEVVKLNNLPDQHTIKIGQKILIPITASEKEKRAQTLPAHLPKADEEEQNVKKNAQMNGFDATVVQGSKTSEEKFLSTNYSGWLQFVGHSDSGVAVMNEAYALNGEKDDGYLHADEVSQGNFSNTTGVFTNSCQSSKNINGDPEWSLGHAFMKAGAPQHIGAQYKVNDDAGAQFANQFTSMIHDPANHDQVHAAMRETQLSILQKGGAIKDWSTYKHLSNKYTASKYGVSDIYEKDSQDVMHEAWNQKKIKEASNTNPEQKSNFDDYSQTQKALKKAKLHSLLAPGNKDKRALKNQLKAEKKVLKLQMMLQQKVNEKEPNAKLTETQKLLNDGEAIVEIKKVEDKGTPTYFAFITTCHSQGHPKVIAIPTGKNNVDKQVNAHQNLVNFDLKESEMLPKSSQAIFGKINDYLLQVGTKRIFYKGQGAMGNVDLNALFLNGKFLIEQFDVQYLY